MKDDLNRLVEAPPADIRLKPATLPTAMRAKTGLEREQARLDGDLVDVQSTDGVFSFTVRVLRS